MFLYIKRQTFEIFKGRTFLESYGKRDFSDQPVKEAKLRFSHYNLYFAEKYGEWNKPMRKSIFFEKLPLKEFRKLM